MKWAEAAGVNDLTSDDDFFSDQIVKGYFKNHIKVTHTHKKEGVNYPKKKVSIDFKHLDFHGIILEEMEHD